MIKEEIIALIKEHYSRDIRKQLVKSILEQEKTMTDLDKADIYITINKIFSFVLQQSEWEIGNNSQEWNRMPLEIMIESFPKLDSTKWYKEQILSIKQSINLKVNN